MDKQVSKSLFSAKLLEYLRQVEQDQQPLIVTHNGRPVVKVSPYWTVPQEMSAIWESELPHLSQNNQRIGHKKRASISTPLPFLSQK
jgi:prevent-host-death family protein